MRYNALGYALHHFMEAYMLEKHAAETAAKGQPETDLPPADGAASP